MLYNNEYFYCQYRRLTDADCDEADGNETLSVWRKLCFALGGAPFQITNNVLGFFLNIFLLEIAQVGNVLLHMQKKYTFCKRKFRITMFWPQL